MPAADYCLKKIQTQNDHRKRPAGGPACALPPLLLALVEGSLVADAGETICGR